MPIEPFESCATELSKNKRSWRRRRSRNLRKKKVWQKAIDLQNDIWLSKCTMYQYLSIYKNQESLEIEFYNVYKYTLSWHTDFLPTTSILGLRIVQQSWLQLNMSNINHDCNCPRSCWTCSRPWTMQDPRSWHLYNKTKLYISSLYNSSLFKCNWYSALAEKMSSSLEN